MSGAGARPGRAVLVPVPAEIGLAFDNKGWRLIAAPPSWWIAEREQELYVDVRDAGPRARAVDDAAVDASDVRDGAYGQWPTRDRGPDECHRGLLRLAPRARLDLGELSPPPLF